MAHEDRWSGGRPWSCRRSCWLPTEVLMARWSWCRPSPPARPARGGSCFQWRAPSSRLTRPPRRHEERAVVGDVAPGQTDLRGSSAIDPKWEARGIGDLMKPHVDGARDLSQIAPRFTWAIA
jgi:hypothetical protein